MTTMRLYAHTVGEDQRRATDVVAGILRPSAGTFELKSLTVN